MIVLSIVVLYLILHHCFVYIYAIDFHFHYCDLYHIIPSVCIIVSPPSLSPSHFFSSPPFHSPSHTHIYTYILLFLCCFSLFDESNDFHLTGTPPLLVQKKAPGLIRCNSSAHPIGFIC